MIDQDMIDQSALAWDHRRLQAETAVDTEQTDREAVRKLLAARDRDVIALYTLSACPQGILTYASARHAEGGLEYALRKNGPYRVWVDYHYRHAPELPSDLVDAYLNVQKGDI